MSVQSFGTMDPTRDAGIAESAMEMGESPEVTVVAGTTPEGLDLVENGSKMVVLEGFEDRYEVLGTVEGDWVWAAEKSILNNQLGAWKYEEPWRRGYCYWQVPFKIATLTLWSYLPWHYPCIGTIPNKEDERQVVLLEEMKKGVGAMGGDLLVVVGSSTLTKSTIDTKSGKVTDTSITPYMSLIGFAIDHKEGTAEP